MQNFSTKKALEKGMTISLPNRNGWGFYHYKVENGVLKCYEEDKNRKWIECPSQATWCRLPETVDQRNLAFSSREKKQTLIEWAASKLPDHISFSNVKMVHTIFIDRGFEAVEPIFHKGFSLDEWILRVKMTWENYDSFARFIFVRNDGSSFSLSAERD